LRAQQLPGGSRTAPRLGADTAGIFAGDGALTLSRDGDGALGVMTFDVERSY